MKDFPLQRTGRWNGAFAAGMLAVCAASVYAQQPVNTSYSASNAAEAALSLPDAPEPAQATTPSTVPATANSANPNYVQGKQTKRILGIVPNFRSVSADQKLPAQTVHDKFVTTMQDNFDYSSFIFVGGLAGEAMAEASTPQFHQGAAGYARYYWHTFADQTNENTFVEFILPVALRQDSRYYTLGHGGFAKRAVYSMSRTVITRSDSGREVPNFSEVVGAGAAAGISDLYYPGADRDWTKTGQRWLTNVVLDGATFAIKEFWPDINDHVFHQHD